MIDTVADVVNRFRRPEGFPALPVPAYAFKEGPRLALAVSSMQQHMTNEGWEIMRGLGESGYHLCGYGLPEPETNVRWLIHQHNPSVVLLQDKREWDVRPGDFREESARFTNVQSLKSRNDIFKLTILKDSHQRPDYHQRSADEIGCHAWIVYYHPTIVRRLAPYVRERHLIRTYHTIDPDTIPQYTPKGRNGCLLSGAVGGAYPLRKALVRNVRLLPQTTLLPHPGYHRDGSATPTYMKTLSGYKVAICTASVYGYALRKLIEATACGCTVITNLPSDEVLPDIDENLVRVPSTINARDMRDVVINCLGLYDRDKQQVLARKAIARYDYRVETARIAGEIERLRGAYG